jgi:hypothetical protein
VARISLPIVLGKAPGVDSEPIVFFDLPHQSNPPVWQNDKEKENEFLVPYEPRRWDDRSIALG